MAPKRGEELHVPTDMPVGTPVLLINDFGKVEFVTTTSEVWRLGKSSSHPGHTWVVNVSRTHGHSYALSRLRPVPDGLFTKEHVQAREIAAFTAGARIASDRNPDDPGLARDIRECAEEYAKLP